MKTTRTSRPARAALAARQGRRLRICIVADDFVGPIRNGGIGTAYTALAQVLAAVGHDVTVLYCEGTHAEQRTIGYWVRHYARQGITLVPLPTTPPGPPLWGSHSAKRAYAVYRWLEDKQFDIVHVHEWRGVAFYALMAKRQGLCLQDSIVCVGAHSPTLWHREGLREFATVEDLDADHMERETVARADILWCPSHHMASWMQAEGWTLPREVLFRQYLLPDGTRRGSRERGPVTELCFFGRLETRKGLDLFCDAVERLFASGVRPARITFMGKSVPIGGVPSETILDARCKSWPVPVVIRTDMDRYAAIEYLRQPGRVAVMPSLIDNLPYTVLECLAEGIPFVSSDVGGIPEMVHPDDRPQVLFALRADALSERLAAICRDGHGSARFAIAPEQTEREWIAWHDSIGRRVDRLRARRRKPAPTPLVSVCIVHHDRPTLLRRALRSIERQSYPRIEVVLVDDGSRRPESVRMLQRLEPGFRNRGWRIVRQANRYLGAARNEAARHARGKYLLFMDDDNIAKRHEVATFVTAAEATGADVLTCLQDGFASRTAPRSEADVDFRALFLGGATAAGVLRNAYGDANSLVRRASFEAIGGFTEDYGLGFEDWEFFAKAALAGQRVEVVPQALFYYYKSGSGMLATTRETANRLRALRPYMHAAPPGLRHVLHLCRGDVMPAPASASECIRAEDVQRVVIFGAAEGGRRALRFAQRCGWNVSGFVDNNTNLWNTQVHGKPVRSPETLRTRQFDMVLVASVAGRDALFKQLDGMGFTQNRDYAFFLDTFSIPDAQVRLVL